MSKYPGRIVTDLAPAGYSVALNGTSGYLTVPTNAAFQFGTGDFTIEAWIYNTSTASTNKRIVDNWASSSADAYQFYLRTNNRLIWQVFTSNSPDAAALDVPVNAWTHVAWSKSGSNAYLFINGVLRDTTALTLSANGNGSNVAIGADNTGGNYLPGYISNLRILKGTALYTTAFTPPTQLFPITNTSLLTCNSPAIIDQSTNNFTITTNGNAAVSTFTPFPAYVPYNPALGASTPGVWTLDEAMQARQTRQWNMYDPYFNLTTLLLHGNGTNAAQNNTFLDSSSNNFTITRNGNTTQGSYSPFSQVPGYWSNYFDGSGDYLSAAYNSAYALPGDFTIEFLVNWSAHGASAGFVTNMQSSGGAPAGWQVIFNGANDTVSFEITGSYPFITSSITLPRNAWTHVAVVRSGSSTNNVRMYFNGVQVAQGTNTSTLDSTNASLFIGCERTGGAFITGYISNVRIVKGTAVYTTAFTPPTAPLTAITNTQLLTCQSNRFIDNSSNAFALTVNGNVSVQPFSPFLPTVAYTPQTIGGSGYFDGTGDNLVSASLGTSIGTGDYCLEAWVYTTNAAASFVSFLVLNNSSGYIIYLQISANAVRFLDFQNPGTNFIISGGTVNSNEWVHIVATRQSGNMRAFVNGRLAAYQASINFNYGTAGTVEVPPSVAQYVSQVRVNIGSVPTGYQTSSTTTGTQIFTSPTAPTTTTSQGATAGNVRLLLNMTNAGVVDSTGDNVLETVGNAQISTTQSKFGGSSIFFDGTGDYLTSYNGGGLFRLGTVYTVEMWFYTTTVGAGNAGLINFATTISGNTGFNLYRSSAEIICNDGATGGTGPSSGASSVSANTWTHLAVVSNGTTTKLYLDGVEKGSYTGTTGSANSMTYVTIGSFNDKSAPFSGYIDDLRVTRGYARYTGNFTPQTSQWQDQ